MHGSNPRITAAGAVEVDFVRVLRAFQRAEAVIGNAARFEGAAGLERLELEEDSASTV